MRVYSYSHKNVPRVAQRYGTIAAHTRRRVFVLVVFVVFCVHMYSFAGLIRRTPLPTLQSPTATLIPLFSSSELTRADILVCWLGTIVRTCVPGGSRTLDFLRVRRAPYPLGQAPRSPSKGGEKVYLFGPGRMAKMAAMPIYGKNLEKILLQNH